MNDQGVPKNRRSSLIFAETQRFDQPWLRWTLRGVILLFAAQSLAVLVLVEPDPPRVSAGAYGGLVAASFVALVFTLLVSWLLRASRLETVVRKGEIVVRFVPFHASDRLYPVDSIVSAEIVTYEPLREYGGWGIRRGFGERGWAYNVRGDQGLRLVLEDGRRVLIGTQRPQELDEAIRQLDLPQRRGVS